MSSATAFFESDERLRMRRFLIGTAIGAVLLTAGTTITMAVLAPDGGWTVAFGVGAMIGFWMAPLGGVVFGNGYHEMMADRAKAEAKADGPDLGHSSSSVAANFSTLLTTSSSPT